MMPDWTATPDYLIVDGEQMQLIKPSPPSIAIMGQDGRELLVIKVTDDGRLDVTGAEDAWTEGARRFVDEVRRMAGIEPDAG